MSIRVLIVEDSPVARDLVRFILDRDPAIQVVGTAKDGVEAVAAVQRLKPDVVTMDVHMPRMDGYEATRGIMETQPTPIVIVSVSVDVKEVEATFRALEAGALAAVTKPPGFDHPDHEKAAAELVQTVKLMSEVKVVRRWPRYRKEKPHPASAPAASVAHTLRSSENIEIIAMGASTGGPPALQTILSGLPKSFPLPLVIVQHISPGFLHGFAELLTGSCGLPVHVAAHGDVLRGGHVYLAPDGAHMGVGKRSSCIELAGGAFEEGVRPSISYLFRSVAEVFGHRAAGVLLTGMGRDGAKGLKLMREKGAVTIAQDEESCLVFGMPAEAIRLGAAAYALSPEEIAKTLANFALEPTG